MEISLIAKKDSYGSFTRFFPGEEGLAFLEQHGLYPIEYKVFKGQHQFYFVEMQTFQHTDEPTKYTWLTVDQIRKLSTKKYPRKLTKMLRELLERYVNDKKWRGGIMLGCTISDFKLKEYCPSDRATMSQLKRLVVYGVAEWDYSGDGGDMKFKMSRDEVREILERGEI